MVSLPVSGFVGVSIPTNQSFLKQWHSWIHMKVGRQYKRDKDRMFDTVQAVRLRLLSKDFVGRWFYKHLTGELVDKLQAEKILGGMKITFIGTLNPVEGDRTDDNSLWLISDLLKFAKFDYDRYYYSIQDHTIDSAHVLELLGYPKDKFTVLQSMYRQGRLQPAELTEHQCDRQGKKGMKPRSCVGCLQGVALLRARKLSLADDWGDPAVAGAVAKLRWNDSQLRPFLRSWQRSNLVKCTPLYIMRRGANQGIDAGLLKYAEFVINHEVCNDFKRMARTYDMSGMVFNKGLSPETSDEDTIAWESDETDEAPQRVFRDLNSSNRVKDFETRRDLEAIISSSILSEEEEETVRGVSLSELTVRQFSTQVKRPIQRVHRVLASAMRKMRGVMPSEADIGLIVAQICDQHSCTLPDILGPAMFGPCVKARTDLFSELMDMGWSVGDISARFGVTEERIVAAVNRRVLRDMKVLPKGKAS